MRDDARVGMLCDGLSVLPTEAVGAGDAGPRARHRSDSGAEQGEARAARSVRHPSRVVRAADLLAESSTST